MNINKAVAGLLLLVVIAAFSGCAKASNAPSKTGPADSSQSGSLAAADAKKDWPSKIVIVQMPNESNPDAGEKHEGFRQAAENYIGVKVEELEGSDYTVGVEAMKRDKLDVMVVGLMGYYRAKKFANVEPLVTTPTSDGVPYKSIFITRADRDDLNSLEDLKDQTVAFVDPVSTSGYMFAKAELIKSLNLDADQLENPGYFFRAVTYSGRHESSVMGVVMGDYDAAAIGFGTIKNMVDAGLLKEEDIKIIAETETYPNACLVIRGNLPQSLKDKIKEFYLQYDDSAYFQAFYNSLDVRFIEAKDSDYAVVDELIRLLKLEE